MPEFQEIKEIERVYVGLETLYLTFFPKSEPYLIHDLLRRLKVRRGAIWNDVMKLNSEINKRIVGQIRKTLYNTTCSKCVLTGT